MVEGPEMRSSVCKIRLAVSVVTAVAAGPFPPVEAFRGVALGTAGGA